MTQKRIVHEVKFETSTKLIVGVLAVGVFLHLVAPVFDVRQALAELTGGGVSEPFHVEVEMRHLGRRDTLGTEIPIKIKMQ